MTADETEIGKDVGDLNLTKKMEESIRLSVLKSKREIEQMKLDPAEELMTDDSVLSRSIWAMRFAIFADAANSQVLAPNYAIIAWPGADPESFPSTSPLGFGAANYFIPLTATLGMTLSSYFVGSLSDKYGRKPFILLFLFAGSRAKFILRRAFWGFCAANFVNGVFAGSLPVALAYTSDVYSDKRLADAEKGNLITGGGLIAILFNSMGLFAPLWVSAGLSFFAGLVSLKWLIEPMKDDKSTSDSKFVANNQAEDEEIPKDVDKDDKSTSDSKIMDNNKPAEDEELPKDIDNKALAVVILGALVDNIGSAGLIPLALSPLLFDTYYGSFVEEGMEPIMSQTAFRWIFVLLALAVIPGALISPPLYDKVGTGASAVIANIFTGAVTVGLLQIALANPSQTTFVLYVVILYLFFPMTVISQLTTAPMLDRLSPIDKRGYVQGLNSVFMNIGSAIGKSLRRSCSFVLIIAYLAFANQLL